MINVEKIEFSRSVVRSCGLEVLSAISQCQLSDPHFNFVLENIAEPSPPFFSR